MKSRKFGLLVGTLMFLCHFIRCSSVDEEDWLVNLPKVQTHLHLDGSVRLHTIWDIALKDSIDLAVKSIKALKAICQITEPMHSLQEVLDVFWVHQKVLNSYQNIRRITFENIEDAYNDGVKLLELRFAPTFIAVGKPNLTNDDIILGVLDGVQDGMQKYSIEVGLIVIGVRGSDHQANRQALLDVLRHKKGDHVLSDRLVGYDLAATEAGTSPEEFLDLINLARDGGLHITVHSGEDTNSEYIKRTIEVLGVERIGHGIKSWGNEEVLQLIKDNGIHLELSVTSNWLTRSVSSLEEHPIKNLYEEGISISINTDDAHLMGIDLVHEYKLIEEKFGFSRKDFMWINKDALEHSFLPEEIKTEVRDKYFK